MRKYAIFAIMLIASMVQAGTLNLTNDTVYVKTPSTAPEAASKGYVDSVACSTVSAATNAINATNAYYLVGPQSNTLSTLSASSVTNYGTGVLSYVDFAAPAAAAGTPPSGYVRLYGTSTNGQESLSYKDAGGSAFRIGRDLVFTAYNWSGSTLTNGECVYFTTGMVGTAHCVDRAKASDLNTMPAQGIVCQGNITNYGSGNIQWMGRTGTNYFLQWPGYAYGTPLYVSTTNAGQLTTDLPLSPNYRQKVGFLNNDGAVDVRLGDVVISEASSTFRTYQLWSASNSVITNVYQAMRTLDYGSAGVGAWTNAALTNSQYLGYLSGPSGAGLTVLKSGLYQVNATLRRSTGGSTAFSLAAEIYVRATNGVETEITPVAGTSAQVIGTTDLEYIFSLNVTGDVVIASTSSILLKFKVSAVSGSPTLVIGAGYLNVPVPSSQFVLQSDYNTFTNGQSRNMAFMTNWPNAVVDGNIDVKGYSVTNGNILSCSNNIFVGNPAFPSTVPNVRMELKSPSTTTLLLKSRNDSSGQGSNIISFAHTSGDNIGGMSSRSADILVTRTAGGSHDFGIYASDGSFNRNRFQLIGATGYVGINTNSPTQILDVVGNALIRSNLIVSGTSTFSNTVTAVGAGFVGNAAGVTNIPYKGAFSFIITTNVAPYNYAIFGPIPYAITITNLVASGDCGTYVVDYFTGLATNPNVRTLVYTGLVYTAELITSNMPTSISIAAQSWVGAVITNGSITNAFVGGQYTWSSP